jgi:purine-binding chemotaxis protein CheW
MSALAQRSLDGAHTTGHYLTVVSGGELFAVSISRIREVIHCPRITRVPLCPEVVPGVINLRGAVVPLVDLAIRLGRRGTELTRRACIVVVEAEFDEGMRPVGVLVDAVEEAIETTDDMLEARPAFGAGLRQEFQAAMLHHEGRFVSVLELSAVLSVTELEGLVATHALAPGAARTKHV